MRTRPGKGQGSSSRAADACYVHRRTGQVLRVVRETRAGVLVVMEGVGKVMLGRDALELNYVRAASSNDRSFGYLSERRRATDAAVLIIRTTRQGYELAIECRVTGRHARMRFLEAGEALYWYERLGGYDDFLRVARTMSGA